MIRDLDTIVALDYLQHLSVAEKMRGGEMLCLIPNQCSELFLQVGYTTIYHTILGFLTAFSNENPLRAIFFIDLVYPLFIATLVFNLFRKFSKNIIIISIFSVITILTFINGSYETTFFIPQTLAFIIFLITINQKKLKPKDLFAIGILLFFIHFILGTYLLIFLILKYLLIDKASPKALGYFSKYIFFFALFTPIIFLIINSSGFSIESTFQKDAVESIGGYTNLMFPRNIWAYLTIWGGAGAFFFASIFLQHKKKQNWYLYSLIYLSLTLCVYLLAPTYANKFLIGTSIFSILLIIKYLENFKDIVINTLITIIILLSFLPNFYFKYSTYLNFYRQNDNIATAVPLRDKYMLKHTYYMKTDCIFVSDPLTQIQIEGIGNKTTAKAQYIKPEARRKIYEFANNPSKENLTKVLNIEELEGREMCFVYSARLHTSIKRQDINWLFHTYSLAKDNSIPVQESIIKAFMLENHYKVDYQDPNFIVFKKD